MNQVRYACLAASLLSAFVYAAEPEISVVARQRYPWNGKVDISFTITGDSGTKYDTSFKALDVVGNESLPMSSVYKADGNKVSMAESLVPGTYRWVWDAAADVSGDMIKNPDCLSTSSTVVFTNINLETVTEFSAIPCGMAISDKTQRVKGTWVKTDGAGKEVQFAAADDKYTKCVCVHFEQLGNDVVANVKWAKYVDGLTSTDKDFNSIEAKTMTIAIGETEPGYGLRNVAIKTLDYRAPFVCDRVTVVGDVKVRMGLYMVVDLSGGSGAKSYPVSYLDEVPSGGWGDEYKTSKMVLKRCTAGSYVAGDSNNTTYNAYRTVKLTKDFYLGLFEVTQAQYRNITGGNPSYSAGDTKPVEYVYWTGLRGETVGIRYPSTTECDSTSFIGVLRSRTGMRFDLPTEGQWEYACRGGGNSGPITTGDGTKPVGSNSPNGWGFYDMLGNVEELVLDLYYSYHSDYYHTSTILVDPVGETDISRTTRVVKGCYYGNSSSGYPARRTNTNQASHSSYRGFRMCLVVD